MPLNEFDQSMIANISAQQLGAANAAAGAPPGATPPVDPAAAMQQAAPPPPPKASQAPTAQEKATTAAAPQESGAEDPLEFIELDHEEGKRQYTKKQLKSTMDRYRDVNFKWQNMKPVADIVEQLLGEAKKNGYDGNPKEAAELIQASLQAYMQNPQMGQQKGQQPGEKGEPKAAKAEMSAPDGEWEETLSKWEKENAVSLPPMYKDQVKSSRELGSKVDQLMKLVQSAMSSATMGQQAVEGAQGVAQQAQQAQMSVAQQTIKNNLTQSMMAQQIDPAAQQDFLIFAMDRGYTPEDFIDPQLASTVMQDYKANKDAPEINRLREIAKRRQAFTGMVEGAPGGASPPAAGPADPMFNSMLGSAMTARNMG
jgi:hypothetical protein